MVFYLLFWPEGIIIIDRKLCRLNQEGWYHDLITLIIKPFHHSDSLSGKPFNPKIKITKHNNSSTQ